MDDPIKELEKQIKKLEESNEILKEEYKLTKVSSIVCSFSSNPIHVM